MNPLLVSAGVLACVFGGALLGFWLRRALPDHHLTSESKSVLQLSTGLVGTMAALVLGLLTASAKGSFDVQSDEVRQTSANIVQLDRALALYGPETAPLRQALRHTVEMRLAEWGRHSPALVAVAATPLEPFIRGVRALAPTTDDQRVEQARALELLAAISGTRALAVEQSGSTIAWPLLVVVVFWLAAIFTSFGLMADPNATTSFGLLIAALSVSTAIFILLELDQPFSGLIQISGGPLRLALEQLGQ